MKSVLIQPKDKSEYKFVTDLLEKLQIDSRVLSLEEIEDVGLSIMMKTVDRNKKVNRNIIFKKLYKN
jgi:hypothetical protein